LLNELSDRENYIIVIRFFFLLNIYVSFGEFRSFLGNPTEVILDVFVIMKMKRKENLIFFHTLF